MASDLEELQEELHEAIGFLEEDRRVLSPGPASRRWRVATPILTAAAGLAVVALVAVVVALPRVLLSGSPSSSSTLDMLGAWGLQKKESLYTGEDMYNPMLAKVFAMLSKLSYCGPLPGILGSVAYSCGQTGLPGVVTRCEDAGLVVYPGMVRTVTEEDLDVYSAIFGFVARFHSLENETSAGVSKEACIATFRGSIDNFANSVRDKQTDLAAASFKDCNGCKVHAGYAFAWEKMKKAMLDELREIGCDESLPLYFTGHGSGAAVATLAMFDLAMEGFRVQASYVYESPLPGNREFVQSFYDKIIRGTKAPLFSIKYSRDAVTRWPKGSDWYAAGLEVYIAEHFKEGDKPEFCGQSWEASLDCGIMAKHASELTAADTCPSPLAPEGNFCQFSNFAAACYGGIGFESEEFEPSAALKAASSSKSHHSGKSHHAGNHSHEHKEVVGTDISKVFQPEMAKAFAALTKLTYCGQQPGVYASIVSSCRTFCADAGFSIIPGTVRSAGVSDSKVAGAISFFVAKFERTEEEANIPADGCVLAIRGTGGKSGAWQDSNEFRSQQSNLVSLPGNKCKGCLVHGGYLSVWTKVQDRAVQELRSIGCTAAHKSPLYLTGHSMGGAVAEIGMYYLKELGFHVETSYTFEAPRISNKAFGQALNGLYENDIGLFRVTHMKDSVPRTPESEDSSYANIAHEVHVGAAVDDYTVCKAGDDDCGIMQYKRSELRSDAEGFCSNPFAPQGDLCSYDSHVCMRGWELAGESDTSDASDHEVQH